MIYIKTKSNQVFVTALPDTELLRQVSENAILHPNICWYWENFSIFTS